MRGITVGYARHIGRLGALAIALGVGYGFADAPAFADSTDSPGSDSSSSSAASAKPAGKSRTAGPSRRGGARTNATAAGSHASETGSDALPASRGNAGAPERANDNSAPATVDSAPVVTPAAAVVPRPAAEAPAAPATVDAPAVSSPAAEVAPDAVEAAAPATTVVTAPAPAATIMSAVRPAAADAPTPVAAGTIGPHINLLARNTADLVGAVLAPLLGGGTGGSPDQAPLLFGVLAWARQEFERITGTAPAAQVTTTGQTQSPNLLVNPGAELSDPSLSGFSAVSMPGWTVKGTPTVIKYDTPRVIMPLGLPFALPTLPSFLSFPSVKNGATDGGAQFFGGGNVADATITQTVDLSAAGGAIDGGDVSYNLGAWLGGYSFDPSAASVKVTFLDKNKTYLGTGSVGPVTVWDRLFAINLLERSTTGVLPKGTRYAQVEVNFDDQNPIKYGFAADYNDAFADNISFTIGAPLSAPPAPVPVASAPPPLKHVYMVYMENKGYTNVVGSPDAPFLNSLINAYGFADNYYALTHGSLPNYYPIIGGDNFGITYNCASPCIDTSDTLTNDIDNNNLLWKGYAQGLAVGGDPLVATDTYATDQLPFPAFTDIANRPDYAKAHIVSLDLLAEDLKSTATAPNYAWFAADEDNNGEGPVGFPLGAIKFVLNQLDPSHPYNVPALDQFLSETVPTIMNSNAWNSDEASVIVVTFDEDNNNTSLGFGNEGNHIATVVIPNQAAIDAGWKSGSFTASNQYNHYSLLRMITNSLGLQSLTTNDQFAAPMNEFWDGTNKSGAGTLV